MKQLAYSTLSSILGLLVPTTIGFAYAFILSKMPLDKNADDNKEVKLGIQLVVAGHVISLLIMLLGSSFSSYPARSHAQTLKTFFGFVFLFQLIYVIPLLFAAAIKGRPGVVKGMLIAASLTFLLSVVSCFTFVFR